MLPADPEQFARSWIDAWNRDDLDAAMSYYSEETEFSSPWVLTGVDTITLVYRHHGRLQLIEAETMAFQEDGRVVRTVLHYCEHPPRAT